jgi:hypothetical protein
MIAKDSDAAQCLAPAWPDGPEKRCHALEKMTVIPNILYGRASAAAGSN